jgi:hypothetical protein
MSVPLSPTLASPTPDTEVAHVSDSRLRRRLRVPLLVLGALILVAACLVIATPQSKSDGTMLGASGSVVGGIARINGMIPLETDGWLPAGPATVLAEPAGAGTHRVRIILELTALEPEGLEYRADDFTITGLGSVDSRQLFVDPQSAMIAQGQVVTVTQVYELPNQAIELLLRGPGARFVLGTEHHTG